MPAASRARAVKVCYPFAAVVVFQDDARERIRLEGQTVEQRRQAEEERRRNEEIQRQRLPKPVFKALQKTIKQGAPLDPSIADAVAMMSLERAPRPKGPRACQELPSILDALNPGCPSSAAVDALTPADLAYLKALYAADPKWLASIQKGQIAAQMSDALAAPAVPAAGSHSPGP